MTMGTWITWGLIALTFVVNGVTWYFIVKNRQMQREIERKTQEQTHEQPQ